MRSSGSPIHPNKLKADIKKDLGVDTSAGNVRRWLGSLGYCKTPNPIYVNRASFVDMLLWQEETKNWVLRLKNARVPVHAIDQMILLHIYRKRRCV